MVDIRDYIVLSKIATSISSCYSIPDDFKNYYNQIDKSEKKSLIRHFVVNNIPFAFRDKPMLYEQITQYIADKLQISTSEVKLIGSAKTGFSISPLPDFGRAFGQHSDLDFSIVNEDLFNNLNNEFNDWSDLYKTKQIKANNDTEEGYWNQNLEGGARKLKRGFIDTHFIPNRDKFIKTKKINNSLWLIQKYLDEQHGIKVKKVSASVYRSWNSFAGRLNVNTESVMSRI
ncbi:hypothetical protein ACJVDH_07545 [Pedobacter sp. AW1-32]|uniref:hypothetical protein n=1 Tax=Pedobacter sp. AW1-32 TaxID=3383026 RepID=UPI003FF0BA76